MISRKDPSPVLNIALVLSITLNVAVLWEVGFFSLHLRPNLHKTFAETPEREFFSRMRPEERMEIVHGSKEYWRLIRYGFNVPMLFAGSVAGGSHQLMSHRYRRFYDMINMRYPFDRSYYWKDGVYVWPSAYAFLDTPHIRKRCLDLLGVKYLLQRKESRDNSLRLIGGGTQYRIYENDAALPRCFLVPEAVVTTPDAALDALSRDSFNPLEKVLLEKTPRSGVLQKAGSDLESAVVRFLYYGANDVNVAYSSPAAGFLVLTDAYDKGWRAYIDGNESEILRADYLFRAVYVPAGDHTVRFRYLPSSFVAGGILSSATIIVSLLFFLYWWRR